MKRYFKYKDYIGLIEYNRTTKTYQGKVLGLRYLLPSYEGNSMNDLERNFRKVIDEYLNYCMKNSQELPQAPETIIINVTELRKNINLYLDLVEIRKIIITRYNGKKRKYYSLQLVASNIDK